MDQEFQDYHRTNAKLLEKYHPKVFEQIIKIRQEPVGLISDSPSGKPNLCVTSSEGISVSLHDRDAPEKESVDFLSKIPKDHKGFVAILGMGLCYSALNILKERPHLQFLAIFELEPGIFLQALKYTDLSSIFTDQRLILGIGSETNIPVTLARASRTLQLENSNVFHHLPSFKFNPEGYNQLKDDLFSHINSLNVGGATTRILGKNFLNNRFKHISTIHHQLLLEHLHNKFDGVPAILVAGGPSLDKNIHLLKRAQEKAVIIAVDTVLPALLKHDVHPHFLTCIDTNNLTYEKFADVLPMVKNIALICSSWVNLKTAKIFPADQIFWTFTGQYMEAWLNTLLGGKILTGGASTVAHLNLIGAHILGCNPIIFIGQDLAYPNSVSASHAKGTVLQGSAPSKMTTDHIQGETVTGINGEVLQTNRSFLSMKKFFESAVATSSKAHINATEGGANIEGTQILTLQEAMDKHCKTPINTTKCLKEFYSAAEPINTDLMLVEFNKMIDKIKKLLKIIKTADDTTKSLLKELTKARKQGRLIRSFDMLTLPQKKRIRKIDNAHKNLDDTVEVWKILEEITMDGLKKSERQKQSISILKDDPSKYLDWLIKNLNRLLNINQIRKETLGVLSGNLNMVVSFHKKEKKYLTQIERGSHTEQNKIELARFYSNSKNYNLARPILDELCKTLPESGELYFYLGCIAAESNMLKEANHYFQTAIKYDPQFSFQIDDYRKEMGEEFLKFTQYFKTQPGRDLSVKYMVLKGLKYHPDNTELKKELEFILNKDLQIIKSDIDSGDYNNSSSLLNEWHQDVLNHKIIFDSLPKDIVSTIFLYQGKTFLSQQDYQSTLVSLKKAMKYSPDDHAIHSMTIDTLFAAGDFNDAIQALNAAIEKDVSFAAYWETIGDSLQSAGQNNDAILAYEKCFMFLPDNINMLKKIGDCYMAEDHLEAAKSAYQQFKLKLESRDED